MPEKLVKEDVQCLIKKLVKESKKTVESIDSDVSFYKNIIDELEQEKIRLQKYDSLDVLDLGCFYVGARQQSWNHCKKSSYPLALVVKSVGKKEYSTMYLSLHDMVQLRDYLTDKLEFLEYE